MNRRWSVNLSLLVIVGILAVVALWRPGIKAPLHRPPITTLATDTLRHLAIEYGTGSSIIFKREHDKWFMTQPRRGRTNPFTISELLQVAKAKSIKTLDTEATQSLKRYGLQKPKVRLRLDKTTIDFGDANPINNLQYVLVGGRVHLIRTRHFWSVARPQSEFLNKRLIESEHKPIALHLPGLRLIRRNGAWHVIPKQKDVSADQIKQLVDEWRLAQALTVKAYKNETIRQWVRIKLAPGTDNGKPSVLRIGIHARQPELVLYRPDEQLLYHFPEATGARLLNLSKH